jgi:hypothetical protein
MSNRRKYYEKRAEIMTKKLLSKIYSMEASAMETQLNLKKGVDKVNDKIDWQKRVEQLSEERENLNQRYQQMLEASNEKWQEFSTSFENYFNQVNQKRRDTAERANDWIEEANSWVNDMEGRVVHHSNQFSQQAREQLENLKAQRTQLSEKLSNFRSASSERMENMRSDLENEIKNLQKSINGVIENYRQDKGASEEGAKEKS